MVQNLCVFWILSLIVLAAIKKQKEEKQNGTIFFIFNFFRLFQN